MDQCFHPGMGNRRAQSNGCAKGESGEDDRRGESLRQIIQCDSGVGDFSAPVIMLSRTAPAPRKLKRSTGNPNAFSAFIA